MSDPPTDFRSHEPQAPGGDRLSAPEVAHSVGISVATLARLVRAGVVDPDPDGEFSVATALRLRRILRLNNDLHVDLFGAAIIVDLLERLERLESATAGRE